MNIFYIDECHVKAAQYLCDKHIVKMITESAQMLSNVYRLYEGYNEYGLMVDGKIRNKFRSHPTDTILNNVLVGSLLTRYSPGIAKHPCGEYITQNKDGLQWLINHTIAMIDEYDYRYENNSKHLRSRAIIQYVVDKGIPINMIHNENLQQPQVLKDYPKMDNTVDAYRNYYIQDKTRFAKWTKREVPFWFNS